MAPVSKIASRVAWSVKRQSAFGAPLSAADLDHALRLREPLVLNENAERWSDRGMAGTGHDWETSGGRLSQHVEFEIPLQPLPVDFVAYLAALFFAGESSAQNASGAWEHTAGFPDLQTVSEAPVTTLAVHEDGVDWYVQDVACTELTLKGEGSERLQAGAKFLASRIGGSLVGFTWPGAAAQRYLYNYAGSFRLDSVERRPQLRNFNLALSAGIKTDLAWRRVSSEAARIYPSLWPYAPERKLGLSLSLLAEAGDLVAFRAVQQSGDPSAIVLSVLGETIPGSSPAIPDSLEIGLPKAVFTKMDYGYGDGVLSLDLTAEGRYDSASAGPLTVKTTEGTTAHFLIQ